MERDKIIENILSYNQERYQPQEYPALSYQFEHWKKSTPLQGLRILVCTPLFNNTLMEYLPLLAAGADLTVATNDALPFDKALPNLLHQWGLSHVHNDKSGIYDCVLDCGGNHSGLHARLGYAELSRSGFYHYQQQQKPVILVDDSRIKAIETCLGTGNGFLRGMQALGYNSLIGKKLVLFGYGKVGRGIAFYTEQAGAELTVVDKPGTKIDCARAKFVDYADKAAIAEAVHSAWCVITATGIAGAMHGNGAAEILKDGDQLIAAMGIEDEWGPSLPTDRILNHGEPLNFSLDEPTLLRYIDPTMALLNAAALELATCSQSLPAGIQTIRQEIEAELWQAVVRNGIISGELSQARLPAP